MTKVNFKVDSALLRELGERLVGKPYIALAELAKNSYDADASACTVKFGDQELVVADNGSGMTEEEFLTHWMRIGTTHKQKKEVTPRFKRQITGSKGVGRLAVQFLANEVEIRTVSRTDPDHVLIAKVDWREAVRAGELTEAQADYSIKKSADPFAQGSSHGTKIVLRGLKQDWEKEDFLNLARELWFLQPPFSDSAFEDEEDEDEAAKNFHVSLITPDEDVSSAFNSQMKAALRNWTALVTGEIKKGRAEGQARVVVRFKGGRVYKENFSIPHCSIDHVTWRIRIFNLSGRQAENIPVQKAREYFEEFGGVHMYDSGFRLPYFGREHDWLDIEYDHSHRRTVSKLLPEKLRVDKALNDLPTTGRIYGYVKINTQHERRVAPRSAKERSDHLKIQIARDRLVENDSYKQLRDAVRWSLDYYATRVRLQRIEHVERNRPTELPADKLSRIHTVLEENRDAIPTKVFRPLVKEINDFSKSFEKDQRYVEEQKVLLAPLATAGMAALALEHETRRELESLQQIVDRLDKFARRNPAIRDELTGVSEDLSRWIGRVRQTRAVFAPIVNEDDRRQVTHLKVRPVVEQVISNLDHFLRGVGVEIADIPDSLRFPPASLAEWHSVLQNVVTNAVNAMLDSPTKRLKILTGGTGRRASLVVMDTGSGVDLSHADRLFEPFERRTKISPERRALGIGGTGLGLTIVRMIAEARHCKVTFVEPEPPYKTAFQLEWSARQ